MKPGRRIIDDQLYVHFVTFSVYHRRRLLDHDYPRRILLGTLCSELKQFRARCVGFVIMPDHVHALIWLPLPGQLSRFMHAWKRKSGYHILQWYRSSAPRYLRGIDSTRFWQRRYYAFAIYERDKLEEKLHYIHDNPVRAGLAQRPADWKWSSARWYQSRRSVGVPIDWVE